MPALFPAYDTLLHPIPNAGLFFRKIKWAWQRVRRGYSDFDVSELQSWFAGVLPEMLAAFRENAVGFPAPLLEKWYGAHKEELGLSYGDFLARKAPPRGEDPYPRMEAECRQEWLGILGEMRRLFLEAGEDTSSAQNPYPPTDRRFRETEEERYRYRKECREKAFALFCEWFDSLWQ